MKAKSKLSEIMARNPHLDREQVEESLRLRQQLQRLGRGKARYRLASPLTQKRVVVIKSGRIINLTRATG